MHQVPTPHTRMHILETKKRPNIIRKQPVTMARHPTLHGIQKQRSSWLPSERKDAEGQRMLSWLLATSSKKAPPLVMYQWSIATVAISRAILQGRAVSFMGLSLNNHPFPGPDLFNNLYAHISFVLSMLHNVWARRNDLLYLFNKYIIVANTYMTVPFIFLT
jgi:hypothetical protein